MVVVVAVVAFSKTKRKQTVNLVAILSIWCIKKCTPPRAQNSVQFSISKKYIMRKSLSKLRVMLNV